MTKNWTPEPWEVGSYYICGSGDEYIPYILHAETTAPITDKVYALPNAARIVACVNACAGIGNPEALGRLVNFCRYLSQYARQGGLPNENDMSKLQEHIDELGLET